MAARRGVGRTAAERLCLYRLICPVCLVQAVNMRSDHKQVFSPQRLISYSECITQSSSNGRLSPTGPQSSHAVHGRKMLFRLYHVHILLK